MPFIVISISANCLFAVAMVTESAQSGDGLFEPAQCLVGVDVDPVSWRDVKLFRVGDNSCLDEAFLDRITDVNQLARRVVPVGSRLGVDQTTTYSFGERQALHVLDVTDRVHRVHFGHEFLVTAQHNIGDTTFNENMCQVS